MVALSVLLVCALVAVAHGQDSQGPLFKVFFQQTPLYRGRVDPIVQPGNVPSNHVHKVFGGSNFQAYPSAQWNNISTYNDMFASSCTTATITVDKSAYWVPDLYYQNTDGSLALVPNGGLTVYYFGRRGDTKTLPNYAKWTAFPPGFRMVAGNPFVRNYTGTIASNAPSWACLSEPGGAETNYFPTTNRFCKNGLRAQIFFPMCWDGINLDSPTHTTHVSYPTSNYNGGDCPSTHPVRLPGIFFEILYSVDKFEHGKGRQPFVLACGDPTGYGMHGDFLNGWNTTILQKAMNDVSCYGNNTNNGNTVANCATLAPFLKASNPDESCKLTKPIPLFEDQGLGRNISHLPGCDNITVININSEAAVIQGSPIPGGIYAGVSQPLITGTAWRVFIRATNGLYVTASGTNGYLTATTSITTSALSYNNVFVLTNTGTANTYSIRSEYDGQYVTAQQTSAPLQSSRDSVQSWETFVVTFQVSGVTAPNAAGANVTLLSNSNSRFVMVDSSKSLIATGPAAGARLQANITYFLVDANANQLNTCKY